MAPDNKNSPSESLKAGPDYAYVSRLWELGDWEALRDLVPENLGKEQEQQKTAIFKAVALLQAGRLQEARKLLDHGREASGPETQSALLASLLNTLGRAKALQGDPTGATRSFIASLQATQKGQLPVQLYKARISQQIELLGLNADDFLHDKHCENTSLVIPDSATTALTENLSFGFWMNLRTWPTDWTVIVGKLVTDADNELCLRIKNRDTAQLFYGQGDHAIVLHTWKPSTHITLNQWAHLAVVKKQGKFSRLYINGLIRAERDATGLEPAKHVDADIELLGSQKEGRFLNANVQNFWLTDKALTSREVCANLLATSAKLKGKHYLTPPENPENAHPLELMELTQTAQNRYSAANRIRSLDYHELIDALESENLNIVVVGANDGKNNDPLYDYLATTKRKNTVVLIEPQQQLIPYLQENYRFHPSAHIVNAAIGQEGEMTLYGVKQEYWGRLVVPYAKERGWPDYRAPTGVASGNKAHVANWLKKHLTPTMQLKRLP